MQQASETIRIRAEIDAGRWTEAETMLRAHLAHRPHDPHALRLLGIVCRRSSRTNLSIEVLKHAVEHDAGSSESWFELGCSYHRAGREDEAAQAFQTAHGLKPEWCDPVLNLGALADRRGDFADARKWLEAAAQNDPRNALARFNLANVLQSQGEIAAAAKTYEKSLALDPTFAKAHWNLSLCLLLQGDYARGWDEYRWREEADEVRFDRYPQPRLESVANLAGRTVLVHAEQGVGDEIMFAGCLTDLLACEARIVLVCEPRLAPLFARSFPMIRVEPHARRKDRRPCPIDEPIDFQTPAGDLPRFFRRAPGDFPPRASYLRADETRVAAWRAEFDRLDGGERPLRVGISWRAGGHPNERRRRSTELEQWLPLLATPGVRWVNLQYGETDRERAEFAARHGIEIVDWPAGDPLADLDEFAARTTALDSVISVGNTTVHLAGALGVRSWVVLPTVPAWRWRLSGETIPWYDSIRCIRRTADEDWTTLFGRAATLLEAELGTTRIADAAVRNADREPIRVRREDSLKSHLSQGDGPVNPTFDYVAQMQQIQARMNAGQWREAERLCDDALAHAPRKSAVWHALAKIARATDRPDLAIRSLERTIALSEPNLDLALELAETLLGGARHGDALKQFEHCAKTWPERHEGWLGIGLAQRGVGDLNAATAALDQAERLAPDQPKVFNYRGAVLLERGLHDAAIAAFRNAVRLAPQYTSAWNNLGCALHAMSRFDQAAECFAEILRLEPHNETAADGLRSCLALAESKLDPASAPGTLPAPDAPTSTIHQILTQAAEHFNADRYDDAARLAEQVLALQARHPVALRITGVAQRRRGEHDAAIAGFQDALAADPQNHALHFELGVCYLERHQHRAAYDCFLEALRCKPNFQPCYVNLSGLMEQQERYEDATSWAIKAVEANPQCRLSHYNLGNSFREQGNLERAIESYRMALKLDPEYHRATWNLGICQLHLGNYAEGWPGYELRSKVGEVEFDDYRQPMWRGESLTGKTILVHAEQGLGDEIVFCSCLPELSAIAGRVIVVCEYRLEKLFARSFPGVEVHGYSRRKDKQPFPLPAGIDYQIPMGSLPLHFRNSRAEFPRRESFLIPDAKLVAEWRARYEALGSGMKVGVSWRAGGKPLERRKRSLPLELWGPIFETAGVDFVNLQYGDTTEDVEDVSDRFGITLHDWEQGDPLIDLENYAAKIAALDLVISVGNATVHMAGGVGTPAWTMLPMIPSWRWMIRGDESPWYKTVRLFRQPERKNWAPLVECLGTMLGQVAASAPADRRRAAATTAAPKTNAVPPPKDKPLAEHVWLDHTQFSAGASLEKMPAMMETAQSALAAGELDQAEAAARSILQIAPRYPAALHQLGLIALAQGRPEMAVRSLKRALSTAEAVPLRRCDLALALRAAGRTDEAIASYRRAIEIQPEYERARRELGELLNELGRTDEARIEFAAIAETPIPPPIAARETTQPTVATTVESEVQACRTLIAQGRWDHAATRLREVPAEHPEAGAAAALLAELALQDRDYDEAIAALKPVLARQPSSLGFFRLGEAYEGKSQRHDALLAFAQATELDPYHVSSLARAGSAALGVGRIALAEKFFRLATTLQPDTRELWNSLGTALRELGRRDDAITAYRRAIEISPEQSYPAAEANLSLVLIHQGEFREGWQAYRRRWECGAKSPKRAMLEIPEWNGLPQGERTLLIQSEQGLGDELMFGTCYRDALASAPRIIATCDERLETLMKRSFPSIRFLPVVRGCEQDLRLPKNLRPDLQIAAGELPALFRAEPDDFPATVAYLRPDAELLAEWQARLDTLGLGPKIGIAWRGGQTEKDLALRSLDMSTLCELLKIPGVRWVNLQAGTNDAERAEIERAAGVELHDWPEFDLRDDLENLAARIAACDMVISVGNAVVHLAGALGTPTHCLLPAHAGWRWGTEAQPTPWYESVHVLRQTTAGDWTDVIRKLTTDTNHTPNEVEHRTERPQPVESSSNWSVAGTPTLF